MQSLPLVSNGFNIVSDCKQAWRPNFLSVFRHWYTCKLWKNVSLVSCSS